MNAANFSPLPGIRVRDLVKSFGATRVIDRTAAGGNRPVEIPRVGFAPTNYTVENDGVVWMFEKRRLAS